MPVTVDGADRLAAGMKHAGQEMLDMTPTHGKVAGMVADATRVPRLTGRLAASVRPAGQPGKATVRAGGPAVPYAGVIHWGWPRRNIRPQTFLADAAANTEPAWLATYAADVQTILDTVTGA